LNWKLYKFTRIITRHMKNRLDKCSIFHLYIFNLIAQFPFNIYDLICFLVYYIMILYFIWIFCYNGELRQIRSLLQVRRLTQVVCVYYKKFAYARCFNFWRTSSLRHFTLELYAWCNSIFIKYGIISMENETAMRRIVNVAYVFGWHAFHPVVLRRELLTQKLYFSQFAMIAL